MSLINFIAREEALWRRAIDGQVFFSTLAILWFGRAGAPDGDDYYLTHTAIFGGDTIVDIGAHVGVIAFILQSDIPSQGFMPSSRTHITTPVSRATSN
jgi:hypothetical protein